MDAVGPQVDVVHARTGPVRERARSSCQVSVSLVIVAADRPAAEPRNCPNAGTKSPDDSPCRYSSGSTSLDLRGLARPRRQDRRREPLPLTGFRVDALVVDPRRVHLDRARAGGHLPRLVVAVAHHQPAAVLVALVGEPGDVGVDLGLQRLGQHPPGTLAHESHRSTTTPDGAAAAEPSRSAESETTVSMGRTFPTSVAAPVLLGTFIRSPGKVRPFPADPQISSIAPIEQIDDRIAYYEDQMHFLGCFEMPTTVVRLLGLDRPELSAVHAVPLERGDRRRVRQSRIPRRGQGPPGARLSDIAAHRGQASQWVLRCHGVQRDNTQVRHRCDAESPHRILRRSAPRERHSAATFVSTLNFFVPRDLCWGSARFDVHAWFVGHEDDADDSSYRSSYSLSSRFYPRRVPIIHCFRIALSQTVPGTPNPLQFAPPSFAACQSTMARAERLWPLPRLDIRDRGTRPFTGTFEIPENPMQCALISRRFATEPLQRLPATNCSWHCCPLIDSAGPSSATS